MSDAAREERLRRLSVDIDTRLSEVWAIAWGDNSLLLPVLEDEQLREPLGCILRAAYAAGYRDALQEDKEGRRDELARANGYARSA